MRPSSAEWPHPATVSIAMQMLSRVRAVLPVVEVPVVLLTSGPEPVLVGDDIGRPMSEHGYPSLVSPSFAMRFFQKATCSWRGWIQD